jgi:hypothetical protein
MKKLLLVLFTVNCFAQAPTIQWQKNYGGTNAETVRSITLTSDNGYILIGDTNSNDTNVTGNHGNGDCWVVKIDQNGILQWQKTLGGSFTDQAANIKQTPDGGYILAATTYSHDGDITSNHGTADYWVVKLSSTGAIEWQKTLGGSVADQAKSIALTNDGGYIVSGLSQSNDGDLTFNHGLNDYWIVKLDANGTILWQKSYGSTGNEEANDIKQTTDGGYIIAGITTDDVNGDVTQNYGQLDFWVVKTNMSGTIEWQKSYGGNNTDRAYSIQQTLDNGFIVTGGVQSLNGLAAGNHGYSDFWVIKLDELGNIQWKKTFGGTNYDEAYHIIQTNDGNYIVIGNTSSTNGDVIANHGTTDGWILKLDATGSILWQKSVGGTLGDYAKEIKQTPDNGYIIAGYGNSTDGDATQNYGNTDFWIVKLSPDTLSNPKSEINTLTLFPNPVNNLLNLQTPNDILIDKIKIIDLTGKVMLEQTDNSHQLNTQNLASGMYLLQAFSGENKYTTKFIKE